MLFYKKNYNCELFINLRRRNYSICVMMGRFTVASGLTPDEDAILNEIREKGNFELSSIGVAMMAQNLNMTTERVANAFGIIKQKRAYRYSGYGCNNLLLRLRNHMGTIQKAL